MPNTIPSTFDPKPMNTSPNFSEVRSRPAVK